MPSLQVQLSLTKSNNPKCTINQMFSQQDYVTSIAKRNPGFDGFIVSFLTE